MDDKKEPVVLADLLAIEKALLGHESIGVFGVEILPDPQDFLLRHLVLPVHRLDTQKGGINSRRQITLYFINLTKMASSFAFASALLSALF